MATWLIHKGANIKKTLILNLDSTAKPKSKYWMWKPQESTDKPASEVQTSLFQGVVHKHWQGAVYVMMNQINKFGISYVDAIEVYMGTVLWNRCVSGEGGERVFCFLGGFFF